MVALSGRADIRDAIAGERDVRLLWRLPQYRTFDKACMKTIMMLATLFLTLVAEGVLSDNMVARAMTQLDRIDGDIDTLMTRLYYIRT